MGTKLKISCKFFSKEDGGRSSGPPPLGPHYRPHLRGRDYLGIRFCEDIAAPHAGQEITTFIECMYEPEVDYSEVEPGKSFDIMEGGSRVGIATILVQG